MARALIYRNNDDFTSFLKSVPARPQYARLSAIWAILSNRHFNGKQSTKNHHGKPKHPAKKVPQTTRANVGQCSFNSGVSTSRWCCPYPWFGNPGTLHCLCLWSCRLPCLHLWPWGFHFSKKMLSVEGKRNKFVVGSHFWGLPWQTGTERTAESHRSVCYFFHWP